MPTQRRSKPNPSDREQFQVLVKCVSRARIAKRACRSEGRLFHLVGSTTEEARFAFETRAKGAIGSSRDVERMHVSIKNHIIIGPNRVQSQTVVPSLGQFHFALRTLASMLDREHDSFKAQFQIRRM